MDDAPSRRTFLSGLAGVAVLAALPLGVAPAAAGLSRPARRRRPRVRLGAWTPGPVDNVADLERELGRRLDIVHWYQGWGVEDSGFDISRAQAAARHGALPMVTWEPWDYRRGVEQPEYRLATIARGDHDDYIRAVARQLRDHRRQVWLRFAHEMNGRSYPWSVGVNGTTAEDYVAAWRRVVRLVRREGATNVRFVWCPVVVSPGSTSLARCFPGDRYVDLVGMDGYNAGSEADWGGWLDFDEVFGPTYSRLRMLSRRPVVIAETGCAEGGGSKARWLRTAFLRHLPERFPAVRAVVWFNERREADWRLQSTPASLAAARQVFASGPFA